jgi:adenylyltransferase/sulfurtransferase
MQVQEINVNDLNERIQKGDKINLLDVREQFEYDMVNLDGKLIPLGELESRLSELEAWKDQEVIIHCRSGARSAEACRILMRHGFKNPINLQGGINRWAMLIDPSMPMY